MSVSGTYDMVTKTPMGDQRGKFVVVAHGDSFTGTLSSDMMGSMVVTDGKLEGNKLIWRMEMKVPMPMSLDCEATVEDDELTGTVTAGAFGAMQISGIRED